MRPSPGQGGLEEFLALNPKHLAKEESRRHKSSDLPPGVLLAGVGGGLPVPPSLFMPQAAGWYLPSCLCPPKASGVVPAEG